MLVMAWPGITAVCVLLVAPYCSARSIDTDGGDEDVWSKWSGVMSVGLGTACLVSTVMLLALCAEFCRKQHTFKEFENNEAGFDPELNPTPVASDFSMYPPVESTPDAVANLPPVTFEPLPDLSQLRPRTQVENTVQLRPKVSVAPPSDYDEDYDVDDVATVKRDPSQDNIKLHNMLLNSRNQIPREQVQYIKELGSGWFGKVLQGEGQGILPGHKKTKVVIQMLKEDASSFDQLSFLQEGIPYRDVDHANVMKLYGQCVDASPFLNVLELCPFGDMKTYLRSHRVAVETFNDKGLLLKFASDIAAGLQAMHEANYVHRDFAARNCLLSSDLTVKVGDYGVAECVFKEDYFFDNNGDGIPVRWLSPECVDILADFTGVALKAISKQCNIWSFGVVIWEILTFGNLPYADLSDEHVLRLVIQERSVKLPKPDVPVSHLDRLYQLMQLCWSVPRARPNLRELRIMLLHLLSNKINSHSSEFEKKWNQLMPRRQPAVVNARPPASQAKSLMNGAVSHAGEHQPGAVPYSDPAKNRPQHFESNFAPLTDSKSSNQYSAFDESTLAQSRKSAANVESTPINELSLAAELSSFNMRPSDVTPVNDKSLADEFHSLDHATDSFLNESVESRTNDDIIILDSAGDRVENSESLNGEVKAEIDIKITGPKSEARNDSIASPITHPIDVSNSKSHYLEPEEDGDFITSTPKRGNDTGGSDVFVSTAEQQESAASSHYHTAYGTQSSQESAGAMSRSSRGSDDDRSMLGPRKFAAMLQTVVTSFDDESGSWSFDNTGASFEAIAEEDEASLGIASSDVFTLDTPDRIPDQISGESEDVFSSVAPEIKEDVPKNKGDAPINSAKSSSKPDFAADVPSGQGDGDGIPNAAFTDDGPALETTRYPDTSDDFSHISRGDVNSDGGADAPSSGVQDESELKAFPGYILCGDERSTYDSKQIVGNAYRTAHDILPLNLSLTHQGSEISANDFSLLEGDTFPVNQTSTAVNGDSAANATDQQDVPTDGLHVMGDGMHATDGLHVMGDGLHVPRDSQKDVIQVSDDVLLLDFDHVDPRSSNTQRRDDEKKPGDDSAATDGNAAANGSPLLVFEESGSELTNAGGDFLNENSKVINSTLADKSAAGDVTE